MNAAGRIQHFHRVDDPWSYLLVQVLERITERYDVEIRTRVLAPPPAANTPQALAMARHALRDAADQARHWQLDFPAPARLPGAAAVTSATRRLLSLGAAHRVRQEAITLGRQLFDGDGAESPAPEPAGGLSPSQLHRLDAHLQELLAAGQPARAALCFRGRWYGGIERLHHLEHDLLAAGLRRPGSSVGVLAPRHGTAACTPAAVVSSAPFQVDAFFSFRSPYAYLAIRRLFELPQRLPVRIRPRVMLPGDGVSMTPARRVAIVEDVAREALRHGLRFGNLRDPAGPGLGRLMQWLAPAEAAGRLEAWIVSAMEGIWADGLDAADDADLQVMLRRAGLEPERHRPAREVQWRADAAGHRHALEQLGLHAGPVFRVGDYVTWGQDRLPLLEAELLRRIQIQRWAPVVKAGSIKAD